MIRASFVTRRKPALPPRSVDRHCPSFEQRRMALRTEREASDQEELAKDACEQEQR